MDDVEPPAKGTERRAVFDELLGGFVLYTEVLAERAGLSEEDAREHLEEMADNGQATRKTVNGRTAWRKSTDVEMEPVGDEQ